MRASIGWVLAASVALAGVAAAQSGPMRLPATTENLATTPAAAPAHGAATAPTPACPGNPNALGISRVVEIDTSEGPGFGFEHFKAHDFLRPREVVLTFDDGPWPHNTPDVLGALAAHCVKATFFPIGRHTLWHPELLRQVAESGHTIGSHTWSHANLARRSFEQAKDEIEMGISAVRWATGTAGAPFFRFPRLRHPPKLIDYLGRRNIAVFSTDIDSFDFRKKTPERVIDSVLAKLEKHGKGMVLLHDFQHATALAMPELLDQLKANDYRIVHLTAKAPVQTIAAYDGLVAKTDKLSTLSRRPTSSVVRTIGGR